MMTNKNRSNMKKTIILGLVCLPFAALALNYAMPYEEFGYPCATIESGDTPFPEGSAFPVPYGLLRISSSDLVIEDEAVREKTQAEKDAFAFAKATAMEASVSGWQNSKSNHTEIILMDNRFIEILGYVNASLISEGIISEDMTPQTMEIDQTAFYLVSMTNQTTAAALSSRLDTVYRYNIKSTMDMIGMPPDGSTILFYIQSH